MNESESPRSGGGGAVAALMLVALAAGVLLAQFLPADLLGVRGSAPSAGSTAGGGGIDEGEAGPSLFTCGMHPQVVQEGPGSCPICGMDLTPLAADATPAARLPEAAGPRFVCADYPMIVEDQPGICPIDGQPLVPMDPGQLGPEPPGPEPLDIAESAAPMRPQVELDVGTVQKMNVRTAAIERRDLRRSIRTVGYLEYDQQRMVTVTTKYSGWIEKVYVNYVGEKVRAGEPLFEIYSPELVQTERELLSAARFAREMEAAPEDARRRAQSLVDSARLRLGYWDVSDEQIRRLEETGEVFRTLEVRAPADGVVMQRLPGLEGMAVKPGMELFHIADLSSLWVEAELFEDHIAHIREGMAATIELSYFPGEAIAGRVRILEPALSETARTLRVKISIPNRDRRLRKGMYATVTLEPLIARQVTAVPLEAVLRSGTREVVVLDQGGGRFAPREVQLGVEAGDYVQVLSGVESGQTVVTSAQFLLDSESSLRESIQKLINRRAGASASDGTVHGSHSH